MIIDFLQAKRTKEELRMALEILREFKSGESEDEWLVTPFSVWVKLEQLEEYLDHLVTGAPLQEDTLAEIAKKEKTT